MRFCVDAHAIGCHLTGNEVYVRSLLNAFAGVDSESEFIAYLAVDSAVNALPRRIGVRRVSRNPFLRLGYELSRHLRRDQPDLLHVQYTAPVRCPVPIVVSVHDVSFIEHPEYFSSERAWQLRLTVGRTVARAERILTVSEFSRQAIANTYGINGDRVVVVPNAAGSQFRPLPRETASAIVLNRLKIPAPFILMVGDLQPRKNQVGLVRAFAAMIRAFPQLRHHLVLAGKDKWRGGEVRREAQKSGVSDRIHFTGFVADEDLLYLYNACEFFVFPSFYEGFGLPVLEAMACARAVACSSTSAVHEVADAAALLFDPQSTDELTRAMLDLALNPELRVRMERLGLQRSAHFSWRKSAQQTLEVYYEVARDHSRKARAGLSSASVSNQ